MRTLLAGIAFAKPNIMCGPDDYVTTAPTASSGIIVNSNSYCWYDIRRECVGEASRRARGAELDGDDGQSDRAG